MERHGRMQDEIFMSSLLARATFLVTFLATFLARQQTTGRQQPLKLLNLTKEEEKVTQFRASPSCLVL